MAALRKGTHKGCPYKPIFPTAAGTWLRYMLCPASPMNPYVESFLPLFVGYAAGGAVHLLLAGALALFPWRALKDV